ncbi:MAG TPA: carboxypeptidase-like regulatory domain-containing protein [Terriglobia bacterium]|nr:carboxypeptidase-like regulatory domain-containing protein [Terriglobia bacterium]
MSGATGPLQVITRILFLLGVVSLVAALPQQAPPRVTVSGITFPADSSEPLGFVTVTLTSLDDSPAANRGGRGGPPGMSRATSDGQGKFSFGLVAPGRYAISSEREGYTPEDHFQFGRGQPTQSILTVTAGKKIEGLLLMLNPAPAISGTVFGPYGQRLAGVTVQAYRVRYTPYGRQLVRETSVLSHEGGEYRLFRLAPGYYYVSASFSDRSLQPWKSLLEISPNLPNPDDGYSTIFYPGEFKASDAKSIGLYNGGVSMIDIGFKESRYFSLSVKLILPQPHPLLGYELRNPRIAVLPTGTDLGTASDYVIRGSGTNFSVNRLAEGDYVLVALADVQDGAGNGYPSVVSETYPIHVSENREATVVAMDPFEIPGSIPRGGIGSSPTKTQIQLVRIDSAASQTIVADVDSSGRYNLLNVGPGTYDVFVEGMPRNAYLQEARFPNADRRLSQVRIDAVLPSRTWVYDRANDLWHLICDSPIAVSVNPNGNVVSGGVVDHQGRKVAAAKIVLVPIDPAARLRKDRYGITYSDAMGEFQVQGLPPEAYTAYAFEKIEPDIYFDAEFNSRIAPVGRPVTVGAAGGRPFSSDLIVVSKADLAGFTQ